MYNESKKNSILYSDYKKESFHSNKTEENSIDSKIIRDKNFNTYKNNNKSYNINYIKKKKKYELPQIFNSKH